MEASAAGIGFIGLGQMGAALASRLVTGGGLVVFDRDAGRHAPLTAAGASAAGSAAELARQCDVICTCLPTSELVRDLLFGEGGIADAMPRGGLVIDMTTGAPGLTREIDTALRGRDLHLADAPVSGGPQAAAAGSIAIMVGAPPEVFDRAARVLQRISPKITHVGGIGSGHTLKLVNNLMAAGNRILAFQAVAMAAQNGIDPRTCIDVINGSSGRNMTTEVNFPRHILTENLEQRFGLALMQKDVSLAAQLAAEAYGDADIAHAVLRVLTAGLERLGPAADVNHLIRLYEAAAGRPIAKRQD